MTSEYVDLLSGEIVKDSTQSQSSKHQNITINDASSAVGKILVKEFGSDLEFKKDGRVDNRKFSNISSIDVFWLMYFGNVPDLKGGEYARRICNSFLANRFSVGGGHKKKTVEFQESLGGQSDSTPQKDNRNVIQKYITQRGKPDYGE